MIQKHSNPCVRCGKERIKSRQWKEQVINFWGKSEIVYEETVCPDIECQKIVDEKLKAERDKTRLLELEREERMKQNKIKRYNLHLSNRKSK